MKKVMIFAIIAALLLAVFGVIKLTGNMTDSTKVKIETTKGDIILQLYEEEMPITAGNFKDLVQKGFYDGIIFHRVIDNFMIQGGDPTGTGSGGPGYVIKDEFTKTELDENNRGTISMANAGPNTGGSQFFINLVDNNYLDGKHPVFGKVIKGMGVVDAIGKVKTNANGMPLEEIKIIKVSFV